MVTPACIEALKQVADIVDVISSYVEVSRAGVNYKACCPFHEEKTPSFIISPAKGYYHCYGCGVGGDVINFVQEYEKISFVEAIEKIADMFNFPLIYDGKNEGKKDDIKLLEVMSKFYQRRLFELPQFMEYLHKRGVNNAFIEKFNLGYCGGNFETLRFCEENQIDKNKLTELGALKKDANRFYTPFSNRIMFPIALPSGKIVGFGGRITTAEKNQKYINSEQTKYFSKRKLLYGYHIAKEHIYKEEEIIITEGYLDVIMLHQAGFNTAVATLGTALTEEHLPLISKGNPKVILSYDGDEAGIKAAFRASILLAKDSKKGGVVLFENGMDPADMVANKQIEKLQELLKTPVPFVEFIFKQIALKYNLNDPVSKEDALKESISFLHSLSPLLQEEYKGFLAEVLKIPRNLVIPKYKGSINSSFPKMVLNPKNNDRLESLIIRYILEDKSLLNKAVEYISMDMFKYRLEEFQSLCKGDFESPNLIGLHLDETLLLEKNGFEKELLVFLCKYYENELKKMPQKVELSFEEKNFKIRKLKEVIVKLKKGELTIL